MARTMNYKKPKDTKKTLKRLLGYLGVHKIAVAIVAILVTVSSVASIFGTYLLKPVVNRYILPGDVEGLARMLFFMGVMYAVGVLATYGYGQIMARTGQQVVSEIREDLFRHTQGLPLSYFDGHTHGELMSRFTNDVDTISEALNNSFTTLIQSFFTIAGTIICIILLNFKLSLIVLVFMLLMFFFIKYSGARGKRYFNSQQKYLGEINGFIEEMVDGQKVEKVFNHEEVDFKEFSKRNENLRKASTSAFQYSGMLIPTIVSLSYVNYAVSACVGGLFVIQGMMDLGSLASYLVYVRQSAMPVNQFTMQVNFLLAALSGAERIFDMMDEELEWDEGTVTLCRVREKEDGSLEECRERSGKWAWKDTADGTVVPLCGDVRFHEVEFGYTEKKQILKKISLYAKPGQKIAFVGSTGAGKTTIINLINRFYDVQGGCITYDGIDVKKIKKADLRRSLGLVLQDTHLFTGTIAENIRYGNLDASQEEVEQAAKLANADSFIRRLPNGYDTMIESDGANLSQGQRQLLAIARAAVADPPVLILDEATSSIDTRTERLIEKGMDSLMKGRTVFVIAHRLSTVRNSNAIMVLDHGEIIERGDHEELLEQRGRYYQLYTGQFELE
ncbi:MAG: ABC transporter ATP-binding protein [Faecalimonas umbilicata]|uniref:ABC transporter ATP-binding protein n=1 Tax=Faecalimonas umbilicata TaxID=1912855 RepID=UPI002A762293|nr:ABC transporter ATP-binding protein [Faecalimonas umbilicata]MDY2762922.1 ABC transporter ATP-binding protein [Faecalimonas umbilicata]